MLEKLYSKDPVHSNVFRRLETKIDHLMSEVSSEQPPTLNRFAASKDDLGIGIMHSTETG